MGLWPLAFKNLWRNPRRTLVTGLALASGFAGLSLFSGFVYRIERSMAMGGIYLNQMGHFSIMKRDFLEKGLSSPKRYSLNVDEQLQIQKFLAPYQDDLAYQTPLFVGMGLVANGCRSVPFFLKGISPEFRRWNFKNDEFLEWSSKATKKQAGRDFVDFDENENPLMITETLARLLNKKSFYTSKSSIPPAAFVDCQASSAREQIGADPSVQLIAKTLDGGIGALDANIVGHFTLGFIFLEDMGLQAPLSLVQRLFDTKAISRWVVYLKNPSSIDLWRSRIRPNFEKQFPHLEMFFFDDVRYNPFYVGTTSFLNSLSRFFVFLTSVAIALAIANSLTISILERSREIGTLRALGYNPSQLAWLLSREMLILTIASLTAGVLITQGLALFINLLGFTYEPPGSSSPIFLEIHLNAEFQALVFIGLCAFVGLGSYLLARKKLVTNLIDLLVEP